MGVPQTGRVEWVDHAKGFCIIMVVMMHSTLGVEMATGHEGWMHAVVSFARPFRMPDFFLISGLFLSRVIDRDWRTYLDRKVVHFAYFYVIWMTIQIAFKAPGIAAASADGWAEVGRAYLMGFIDPFGTLWFIYMLPIFFVVTRLTRGVPPLLIWLVAAALEVAHIETGWTVIDEFAQRFVYFYTGYTLAPQVFALAGWLLARPRAAFAALLVWAVINGGTVAAGYSQLPLISLALGIIGAGAVITGATLMTHARVLEPLRYCGQNSIVIYLAFFLPMAASRAVLLKTGVITDLGTISLLVTASGVIGALVWFWAARLTPARFLFARPAAFKLERPRPAPAMLQPAE